MKYVSQALLDGERPLHIGSFHWMLIVQAFCWLILLGWFFGIGTYIFFHYVMLRFSTEMVITDRRLIYKTGVIARRVAEINIDRIESSVVNQNFLGRILGYGTVDVHGTGIGEIDLPPMANPVAFRKALDEAREYHLQHEERIKREV